MLLINNKIGEKTTKRNSKMRNSMRELEKIIK